MPGLSFLSGWRPLAKRLLRICCSKYSRVVVMHIMPDKAGASPPNGQRHDNWLADKGPEKVEIDEKTLGPGREIEFRVSSFGSAVCRCSVWTGPNHPDRDIVPTDFVSLNNGRFMLGELATEEQYRNKGYAAALIFYATQYMFLQGSTEGIAVIWHSNIASLSAFNRSGWLPLFRTLVIRVKGVPFAFCLRKTV